MRLPAAEKSNVISFETHPHQYRHWQLRFEGHVATLSMDVDEDAGLSGDYTLKLNSYDLGVDIELADALDRIRFEHPEVHAVLITSLKERVFCSGANIYMLAAASHELKVNFCKFTNETRLAIEDASANSGLKFLAVVNGVCAGGGYELALACDEIFLVDDGNSTVSLPEVALLGVLPGTGGLTRLVGKRKVRRDRADVFTTIAQGMKGRQSVEWGLVDQVVLKSRLSDTASRRAEQLAGRSDRPPSGPGISLGPLNPKITADEIAFRHVTLTIDRQQRLAHLTVHGPDSPQPDSAERFLQAGSDCWALRAFRELDRALLHMRLNEPEIGTLILHTAGDSASVLAVDAVLEANRNHWLVREIIHYIKRTLKRLDNTARSIFALIEPGSCFAGTLLELALAADRSYMLDDPEQPNSVALSPMNAGPLLMGNGLTRLATRFLDEPDRVQQILEQSSPIPPADALELGLVTFAPDELDWEDDVRFAIEQRVALSPDALTGMEANLRFAGPETLETKIFGRLSAWQNWVFQRPNAVGETGALKAYGNADVQPGFDWKRT